MEEEEQVEEVEQVVEGDAASSSSLRSGAPWRRGLLLQQPVSPGPCRCLPLSHCHGCHSRSQSETLASAGKMKCQAPRMTTNMPGPAFQDALW